MLTVWGDCTAEEDEAERALQEEAILAEQELMNKMAARNYERAVELCLKYAFPKASLCVVDAQSPAVCCCREWTRDSLLSVV